MTKALYPKYRWPFSDLEWFLGPVLILRDHALESAGDGLHHRRSNDLIVASFDGLTAEMCGVSRHTVYRWKIRGLTDKYADQVAIRLGVHPCAIWRTWFDVVDLEEVA